MPASAARTSYKHFFRSSTLSQGAKLLVRLTWCFVAVVLLCEAGCALPWSVDIESVSTELVKGEAPFSPMMKVTFASKDDLLRAANAHGMVLGVDAHVCGGSNPVPFLAGHSAPVISSLSLYSNGKNITVGVRGLKALDTTTNGWYYYSTFVYLRGRSVKRGSSNRTLTWDLATQPKDVCLDVSAASVGVVLYSDTIRIPADRIRELVADKPGL